VASSIDDSINDFFLPSFMSLRDSAFEFKLFNYALCHAMVLVRHSLHLSRFYGGQRAKVDSFKPHAPGSLLCVSPIRHRMFKNRLRVALSDWNLFPRAWLPTPPNHLNQFSGILGTADPSPPCLFPPLKQILSQRSTFPRSRRTRVFLFQ
jgi:hypothetical protein